MASTLGNDIKKLLEESDFDGLAELSQKKRNVVRRLIGMTYAMDDVLSWRAMEAVGRIAGTLPPDEGRELIQRILWMMREESGTNAWSAPYILGEILRETPRPFEDVVPVLASFHEEEFFTAGVLWAMSRIAQRRPELIEPFADVASSYVDSSEPEVRGYAALVLRILDKPFPKEIFMGDETEIPIYSGGSLIAKPLEEIATESPAAARKDS